MTRPLALLLCAAVLALALILPADACGCGAYIPREGDARVAEERALIRWDGQTEDIVMALGVEGESDEAAWILPVPAEATVKLADERLFDELQELTKPLVRVERVWSMQGEGTGGAMAGSAPPVMLLERQELGPFDVSTLAATDAGALGDWLETNGYQFPSGLPDVLVPYVEQGWFYVAVRLTAGGDGEALTGTLDPLWVTFPSDEIVYPMRATALATGTLPVYLYVLAEHRVDRPAAQGTSSSPYVAYADWVDGASLDPESPLRPFIPGKLFLTKFQMFIADPASVTNDYIFPFAASDEVYHEYTVEYIYMSEILGPLAPLALLALVAILGAILLFRSRRSRRNVPAA